MDKNKKLRDKIVGKFPGRDVVVDTDLITMEAADLLQDEFALLQARNTTHGEFPREEGESKESYAKRLEEEGVDTTYREEGESEDDWLKRLYKPDTIETLYGLPLINRMIQLMYGDEAPLLEEHQYKGANRKETMAFLFKALKEFGVVVASLDPKSPY